MRIGAMLGDVVQSLFKRPVTEKYPFERRPAPENLRGQLYWDLNAKCSGCGLCSKDCPSNAIEILTVDKATKRFVVRYHIDRCTYCAQCVKSCSFKCLGMSNDQWELAAIQKEPFTVYYGSDADVDFILAKAAQEGPADI